MGLSQSDQKTQTDTSGTDSTSCKCGTKLSDAASSSCSSCKELEQKNRQQTQSNETSDDYYLPDECTDIGTSSSTNLSPCTNIWDCQDHCVNGNSEDSPTKSMC